MQGSTFIARILEKQHIRYVFGAPGTSDLALVGAIVSSKTLRYIFAFHDGIAAGMADGYARASGATGVVNLHATQGTLNALGFLRVAQRDSVPVLAIASLPGTNYALHEPNHFVYGLETSVAPLVKWSWMARNIEEIEMALHRGLTIAQSLPYGPTFVGIPQDLLEANYEEVYSKPSGSLPLPISRPDEQQVEAAASLLVSARSPLLFLGHSVQRTRSREQAVLLAEAIGANVICEALDRGPMIHGVYFPTEHPLFQGFFSSHDAKIKHFLQQSDVIVFVGCKANYPRVIGSLPSSTHIIQIDVDPLQIGKSLIPDIALLGHLGLAMRDVAHAIQSHPLYKPQNQENLQQEQELKISTGGDTEKDKKLTPRLLVRTLFDALPRESTIVDDSQCLSYFMKEAAASSLVEIEGSMASHIGWALPAALGIKIAGPKRLVVAVVSDGSALFSLPALPTVIALHLPILIVVANNRSAMSLRLEAQKKGLFPDTLLSPLNWSGTSFNFAAAAQAFGITARQTLTIHELKSSIEEAIATGIPYLIDAILPIDLSEWEESWAIPTN